MSVFTLISEQDEQTRKVHGILNRDRPTLIRRFKAHDARVSGMLAIHHPPSLVTCSLDLSIKLWARESLDTLKQQHEVAISADPSVGAHPPHVDKRDEGEDGVKVTFQAADVGAGGNGANTEERDQHELLGTIHAGGDTFHGSTIRW